MSKIAVAAIALFLVCTRPVPVDAVPSQLARALEQRPYEGCWHPGMSRNIGIAEPSCDAPGR
jgi:hypothetical protein